MIPGMLIEFLPVHVANHHYRFDEIKKSPSRFFAAWMAQATWITLCMMPVLALNSIPRTTLAALPVLGLTDIVGIMLYVGGISFEVAADRQKSAWVEAKRNKEHDEDFLTHGLWSKSRHPNYFVIIHLPFDWLPGANILIQGESTLWTGIATTAAGVLLTTTGQKGMQLLFPDLIFC